jgi:hypothetical protein
MNDKIDKQIDAISILETSRIDLERAIATIKEDKQIVMNKEEEFGNKLVQLNHEIHNAYDTLREAIINDGK